MRMCACRPGYHPDSERVIAVPCRPPRETVARSRQLHPAAAAIGAGEKRRNAAGAVGTDRAEDMSRGPLIPMFDYRRIALWMVALLVPGGVLLLPALIADARKNGFLK